LWWLSGAWLDAVDGRFDWPQDSAMLTLPGNGSVSLANRPQGRLEVRYRQGGEAMALPGRGRRDLKRLLNEAAVPGFVRPRLPLFYRNGELVAVANLPQFDAAQVSLVWTPPA